jgi:outer membrane murein-binding lipoprotein Lpp
VAAVIAGVLLAALAGCHRGGPQASPSPEDKPLGAQMRAIESDTAVMREANAAANDVIRQSGDCDAARPLIAPAMARLDEAARRVQTGTGRQTLEALRKKVREVAENCP